MRKVAIQGIAGSFHDAAARMYFGTDIHLVECHSFKTALDAMAAGKADHCIMAIENSIAGSILTNYALLNEYHFKVIGEVYLKVELNLVALPGTEIGDLKIIQSHPVAIKQCAEFLAKFQHVNVLELYDTAECAKQVSRKQLKDTAAIANAEAAELYGLEILAPNIETDKKNFTRFFVLSNEALKTGESNKASISFQVAHRPGSLAKVLGIFAENFLNLSRIQSVPVIGKPQEFIIHVDLEWSWIGNYRRAMAEAVHHVTRLSILGEYKCGTVPVN